MTLDLPIRTPDDLAHAWSIVDGGGGYSAPQLFALLIDADGMVLPNIVQIYDDEYADGPDDQLTANLVWTFEQVMEAEGPNASVAIMKARPGPPRATEADRRWFRALHEASAGSMLRFHPLWFATDTTVGPVPPDDFV